MTRPIIKTIVKLFSIFSNIEPGGIEKAITPILKSYLSQYVKEDQLPEFLTIFEFYNSQYASKRTTDYFKEISLKSVKTLRLIDEINRALIYTDKIYLLSHLAEILRSNEKISPDEHDFLFTIALSFNIPDEEFENLKSFVLYPPEKVIKKEYLLFVTGRKDIEPKEDNMKSLVRENLNGEIIFLHLPSANLFLFYYQGSDTLFLNGRQIETRKIYKFSKGNSISSYKMGLQNVKLKPVYYTELAQQFTGQLTADKIELTIDNIRFSYRKSNQGIKPFRFQSESHLFVGVIGSSGVGKSTFLNILNGNIKPDGGSVRLNGLDIHKNKDKLKGLIGYVPQDDLLFDELTVYENLYFNAKLCFGGYGNEEINKIIDHVLEEVDLKQVKNYRVGNPLDKKISGGQRKRINLALELIREPAVLLVDEPTSGLSSSDSLNIMNLLREQTLKGKLVIVNIHQPSSNIFKLFDQLIVLDDEGTPVYTGDPMDGLVYFKTIDQQVHALEKECPACGSINPEIILDILEDKEVDQTGNYIGKRKKTPEKWYQYYKENIEPEQKLTESALDLPTYSFKRPGLFKQFQIFFHRNVLTKLSNRQYLLISLLEAPLLAVILGFFAKHTAGDAGDPYAYVFMKNVNMPSYLLMSIIVAMFIGLLISAEEIIKDKKVLEREKFLNLSRQGYLFSKVGFLAIVSAFQMLTFVLIGNYILEIKGLNLGYWLILFSVAFFSNMLGLNISAGLKSQIAIYILIPFLLIPQILLSGTIVKFDKMHGRLTSEIHPPFIADLMTSRWAYEALAVYQFRNNKYEKHFYDLEKKESQLYYEANILIPELFNYIDELRSFKLHETQQKNIPVAKIKVLQNEMDKLKAKKPGFTMIDVDSFSWNEINLTDLTSFERTLKEYRDQLTRTLNQVLYKKDSLVEHLIIKEGGIDKFNELKEKHDNESIANLVKRKENTEGILKTNLQLHRKYEPVYMKPLESNGRAQFYSPEKKIGGYYIDTLVFNLFIIWVFNFILYLSLYYNVLQKTIHLFRNKVQ